MPEEVDIPKLLAALGIEATRRGRAWQARCPFHVERTPSWSIVDYPGNAKHGSHHCHGCGEGGGPAQLVAQILGLPLTKARSWLQDGSRTVSTARGVPKAVPQLVKRSGGILDGKTGGMVLPAGVRIAPLLDWVTPAREYLLARGVTSPQAFRWHLGYAVGGRLDCRVVFPIFDQGERLVSYTARSFVGADRKYLEPAEGEHADTAAVFGEERWPVQPEDRTRVVVTEAVLDALAVERATGAHVAAVTGSQLLPGHVDRLATFRVVVVASDPDPAGDKLHAQIRSALARHCQVKRAVMPPGVDPADLGVSDLNELGRRIMGAE